MNNNRKNSKEIAEALNDCMESMLTRNEPMDACLSRYPLYAAELKPLLETILATRVVNSLSAESAFRERARCEFRNALYDDSSLVRRTHPGLALRWATAFSALGILLITGAGGAVAASGNSMPGQPLYQLKRDVENVQLTLTPSQDGKARLYATMADHRVSEIVYAAQSGNVQLTQDLTTQLTSDLNMVSVIVQPSIEDTLTQQTPPPNYGSSSGEPLTTAAATTSTNSASATRTTVPMTTAPPQTVTPTMTQTVSAPVTTMAVPGVPNGISPLPGQQNVLVLPTFQWPSVNGATSYELWIDTKADFSTATKYTGILTNAFIPPAALGDNTTYYWQVRANIGGSLSPWYGTWSFTSAASPKVVITAPPAPTPATINTLPGNVTVTQQAPIPTPTYTLPEPNITIQQPPLNNPALLKLLQQYSVKNLAQLMSILDKVPPSTRAALLAAIQAATSGYGQILGS